MRGSLLGLVVVAATAAGAGPHASTRRWRSDACAAFYAPPPSANDSCAAVDGGVTEACDLVPRAPYARGVREDACVGGRGNATTPPHVAQEVIIVPELRVVFLVNRKAASSTLRAVLTRHFDASPSPAFFFSHHISLAQPLRDRYWTKCGDRREVGACGVLGGRCSSLCLTSKDVATHFFVAIVRDPVARFYSALRESARMGHPLTPRGVDDAASVLDALEAGACGVDHHLESQALALATPLAFACEGRRLAVPVDFVGRVERLGDDVSAALAAAAAVTGRRLDGAARAAVDRSFRTNIGNVGKPADGRAPALDARVRAAYAQDAACFEEAPPP